MKNAERARCFKDARTKYNINGNETFRQVSAATGITVSLLEDLENYKKDRQVAYQKIAMLAKHYGVSTDYLLGLSDCPAVDDKAKAACEYTHLSAKAVKSLNTYFDPDDSFFLGNVVDLANSLIESNTLLRLLLSVQRIRDVSNEIQHLDKKTVAVSKLGEKLVIEKVSATECLDAFIDEYSGYSLSRGIVNDTLVAVFDDMTKRIADIIENESALESEDE